MTFNTKDMNITLDNYGRLTSARGVFGSAPIKAEGQEVAYDEIEIVEAERGERDLYECEKQVEFDGGSYDAELDDA